MFAFLKSHEDFIKFIVSVEDEFNCIEDFESCFGFKLNYDDITGESIESVIDYNKRGGEFMNEPDVYPCVIYFMHNTSTDRFGRNEIRIFDYTKYEKLEGI